MSKRKCIIVRSSDVYNRHICIDLESFDEIEPVLFDGGKYEKKFKYIANRILNEANVYFDLYEKIDNEKGINISEMKFFPNNDNCRVYCQEISDGANTFYVVMAKILLKKKSQKIGKSITQMIDAIKKYEYEIDRTENTRN